MPQNQWIWAVVNGYRADNPAELITGLLPSTESRHTHHRALPYAEVPRALAAVRQCDAWPGTKLLFEFLVLTAVRTEEARGALWSEIHADLAMWIVRSEEALGVWLVPGGQNLVLGKQGFDYRSHRSRPGW